MRKDDYFKAIIRLVRSDRNLFHDGIDLDIIDLAERGLKCEDMR